MTTGKHHHCQGDETDDQPQRAVIVGDHHVVADHPPDHHRNADQQGDNRLPAKTLHGGQRGFLLTFAALEIVLNRFRAVAGFFHRLD